MWHVRSIITGNSSSTIRGHCGSLALIMLLLPCQSKVLDSTCNLGEVLTSNKWIHSFFCYGNTGYSDCQWKVVSVPWGWRCSEVFWNGSGVHTELAGWSSCQRRLPLPPSFCWGFWSNCKKDKWNTETTKIGKRFFETSLYHNWTCAFHVTQSSWVNGDCICF